MQCADIRGFVLLYCHNLGHTAVWNVWRRGRGLTEPETEHIRTYLHSNLPKWTLKCVSVCEGGKGGASPYIFVWEGFSPPAPPPMHHIILSTHSFRVLMQKPPALKNARWTKDDLHYWTIQKGSSLFFFIPPNREMIWGVEVWQVQDP